MSRIEQNRSKVIELGRAKRATKGNWGHYTDEVLMRQMPGLTND